MTKPKSERFSTELIRLTHWLDPLVSATVRHRIGYRWIQIPSRWGEITNDDWLRKMAQRIAAKGSEIEIRVNEDGEKALFVTNQVVAEAALHG